MQSLVVINICNYSCHTAYKFRTRREIADWLFFILHRYLKLNSQDFLLLCNFHAKIELNDTGAKYFGSCFDLSKIIVVMSLQLIKSLSCGCKKKKVI